MGKRTLMFYTRAHTHTHIHTTCRRVVRAALFTAAQTGNSSSISRRWVTSSYGGVVSVMRRMNRKRCVPGESQAQERMLLRSFRCVSDLAKWASREAAPYSGFLCLPWPWQDSWKGTFFIPRDVDSPSAFTRQNSSDGIFRLLFFSLCKLYTQNSQWKF